MSLQQKQQYLRTHIVQKGADAEQFYMFWQNFGIELANATMQDVVAIVWEFEKMVGDGKKDEEKREGEKEEDEDEDQFGEYVEAGGNQHDSRFYQDMNWDFLATSESRDDHHKNKHKKQIEQPHSIQPTKPQPQKPTQSTPPIPIPTTISHPQPQPISPQKPHPQKNQDLLSQQQSPNLNININNVTFQDVLKDSESIKRKCLKLQPNILQHHINVQIFISKFKQVTEENSGIINKLWKATYLLFTIKTIGRNKSKAIGISWEVQRQHSDFQWLRNTLINMYPGLVVPPLPGLVKSQDQLNGYQRKLESFLLDCYNCPELRNSKYFQDFQAFKKSCQSTSKPKTLTHILNMQGQLQLLHSPKLDPYSQGLQSFLTKSSQHLKNVKSIITQIDDSYSQISQKYKELSEVFIVMSEESCQFSDEQCYPRLTETYRQIAQLVNQHSYFCMLEKEFLETFMFSHFAYQRDRVDNMQTLIAKRNIFALEFAKPKHQPPTQPTNPTQSPPTSIFSKITNLFGQKPQSLDIPSPDTTTLRDQVGYYNAQLMKQSIRCIQGMITSHVSHFSMYGHSRIDNVEAMQKLWSKLLVELSRLNKG